MSLGEGSMEVLAQKKTFWLRCVSIGAAVSIAALPAFAGAQPVSDEGDAFGHIGTASTPPGKVDISRIRKLGSGVERWNAIAIDASGLDHTPVAPGENRVFGEQLGPTRASRAMAIVHVAMFEALNALGGQYVSYVGLPAVRNPLQVSARAALSQAAHDTLVALFPSQAPMFDDALAFELAHVRNPRAEA